LVVTWELFKELKKKNFLPELTIPLVMMGSFFWFNNVAWSNAIVQLSRVSLIPFFLLLLFFFEKQHKLRMPYFMGLMAATVLNFCWFVFTETRVLIG